MMHLFYNQTLLMLWQQSWCFVGSLALLLNLLPLLDLQMSRWAYSMSPNCDERTLKSASVMEHRSFPLRSWNTVLTCGNLYRCSVQRSHFWTWTQLQSNGSEIGNRECQHMSLQWKDFVWIRIPQSHLWKFSWPFESQHVMFLSTSKDDQEQN